MNGSPSTSRWAPSQYGRWPRPRSAGGLTHSLIRQVVTAAVVASFLAVFVVREIARRRGYALFSFWSERHRRMVLEVITQEPYSEEQKVSLAEIYSREAPKRRPRGAPHRLPAAPQDLAVSSVLKSHRSDVYLPPLTRPMLSALGLGPTNRRAALTTLSTLRRVNSMGARRPPPSHDSPARPPASCGHRRSVVAVVAPALLQPNEDPPGRGLGARRVPRWRRRRVPPTCQLAPRGHLARIAARPAPKVAVRPAAEAGRRARRAGRQGGTRG